MSSLRDGRGTTSIATWIVVVLAAFVCAWLIVRAIRSGDAPRVAADGGEIQNVAADPPSRALGTNETLGASRCVDVAPPTLLADVTTASSFAMGDALIDARGVAALGIAKSGDAGRTASVAAFLAARAGKSDAVSFVDLGPLAGDDPPPKPFLLKGNVYAARIESAREKRRLVVQSVVAAAVDALGPALKEVASIDQTRDESLAFDVAGHDDHAFVAWDDDDRGRGVVRVARMDAAGAITITVVSPAGSDAEGARVTADDRGGAFVAWVARKVEGDAGGYAIERGAEDPESRFVEVAYLDASGAVTPPVRLQPARAAGFDMVRDPNGVTLVVRDEEGVVEARGAKLLRQSVRLSGSGSATALALDPPVVALRDGVGGLEPMFLADATFAVVAYGDAAERTRLLPLDCCQANNPPRAAGPDPRGSPEGGAPSLEPGVEGGRFLAATTLTSAPGLSALPGITRLPKPSAGAARAVALAAVSRAGVIEARILLCER